MPTCLITGANRGIGLGFVRSLSADGWRVHACCRHPEKAADLKEVGPSVRVHRLDVTDNLRVASLSRELADEPIDLLINNAGVRGTDRPLGEYDYDEWLQVLAVNALSPMRMVESFAGHVAASRRKLIVNISSVMGSIAENESGGSYSYRTSKAALNMITKGLSVDLAARGICVVAFHPGWVQTDMGSASAPVDVEHSVRGMRKIIDRLGPDDSGRFLSFDNRPIPW